MPLDEKGQGMVEYALILALVALLAFGALGAMGGGLAGFFEYVGTLVTG